jgi:hypothetical protein
VVAIEPLSRSAEMYSRGKRWKWDPENEFETQFYSKVNGKFVPAVYYTHVLLPEDYLDLDVFGNPGSGNKTFINIKY